MFTLGRVRPPERGVRCTDPAVEEWHRGCWAPSRRRVLHGRGDTTTALVRRQLVFSMRTLSSVGLCCRCRLSRASP